MIHNHRGFSLLLVIVVITLVAVGTFFYYQKTATAPEQVMESDVPDSPAVSSDWVKRVDEKGYSFFYPLTWVTESRSMSSGAVSQYSVAMYSPPREGQHIVSVTVFPLSQLQWSEDPSAWIEYDSVNKQWISGSCTDFNMQTGCTKAKNVTKTVVASNVTVGGMKSYVIGNQTPTYYLVPINSQYGAVITMTPGIPTIDAISQQILDSFRFSEPT